MVVPRGARWNDPWGGPRSPKPAGVRRVFPRPAPILHCIRIDESRPRRPADDSAEYGAAANAHRARATTTVDELAHHYGFDPHAGLLGGWALVLPAAV